MNSVEHSGDVFSCMLNIQHALKKHDVYKGNYQGMMQLPMVRKLKKENKRLKEQIRILRGETQKKSNLYKNIPKKEEEEEDDVIIISPPDKVVIKIEPEEVAKKQEPSIVVPNAAVVVVVKEDKKETSKVVYELIEKEEEEEDEEEVVEEEEVEEVEVVEVVEEVEEEYLEITINGVSYCTCDQENGSIYELTEDGDIGAVKGVYKNGIPHMDVV